MLVYIGSDHFMFKYNIPKGHRITKKSEKKLHFQLAVQYTGCHFKELRCDGGVAVEQPLDEEGNVRLAPRELG